MKLDKITYEALRRDIDMMFYGQADFTDGMNRIYVISRKYHIVILAFTLMDTHIHFILYGDFDDCNRFMHDYLNLTSRHICLTHGERHKLESVNISCQPIEDDQYLKTVICYVLRNAPVGGLKYTACDYPWSSGPLYFRTPGQWNSPCWLSDSASPCTISSLSRHEQRAYLRSRIDPGADVVMIGSLVFPGEYVAFVPLSHEGRRCRLARRQHLPTVTPPS